MSEEYGTALDSAGDRAEWIAANIPGAGGHVSAYYDRDKRAVTLHYESGTDDGVTRVRYAVGAELGERNVENASVRKADSGIIVTMPAQVFVDNMQGQVPGFIRQHGS